MTLHARYAFNSYMFIRVWFNCTISKLRSDFSSYMFAVKETKIKIVRFVLEYKERTILF